MAEIVLGYVGAAATKGMLIGLIILLTANFFVHITIEHPFMMILFFVLTAVTFSLFGFMIGIWAGNFEQLNLIPMLVVPPLTFLGGSFYSINMLPPFWQAVSHLQSGPLSCQRFPLELLWHRRRQPGAEPQHDHAFLIICLATLGWIFKTGYRLGELIDRRFPANTPVAIAVFAVHKFDAHVTGEARWQTIGERG